MPHSQKQKKEHNLLAPGCMLHCPNNILGSTNNKHHAHQAQNRHLKFFKIKDNARCQPSGNEHLNAAFAESPNHKQ